MAVKQLVFGEAAHEKIRRGIDELARAVRVTLGPRGRTVILEREYGAPQIVNSGVIVARSIELEDSFENLGAQMLKEVAARTSEMAGDGTTTATVLAHSMLSEGLKYLAAGMNPMDLKRGIEQAVDAVVLEIKRLARPCTRSEEIAHVAAISANNDQSIGALIAQAMAKAGRDGAITIEDGSGLANELETVEGLQFDRGWLSPYFINNIEKQTVVLENVAVLICDRKLSSVNDLLPLLESAAKSSTPLLVIAEEIEADALAMLVVNNMRGVLKCCAVKAPGFGDRRKAMLQDIATVIGGCIVSEELGQALNKVQFSELGRARRLVVSRESTTLIGGAGAADAIQARIVALKKERDASASSYDREKLDERVAKLAGGVAVIKVGAATELELHERKLRVEDALHATRAAVDEGLVPGGGVALLRCRPVLDSLSDSPSLDHASGVSIVKRALEEPLRCIATNAADEASIVLGRVCEAENLTFGYNAATRQYGDLMQMGVIDPAKVTRLALQNAASIAGLLLTTDCIIVNKRMPASAHQVAAPIGEPL